MEEARFESWGIIELLGRTTFAGRLSEQTIAGSGFIRLDVPEIGEYPAFTKLFGAGAIYSITPTSEEVAVRVAASLRQLPITACCFPPTSSPPYRCLDCDDSDSDENENGWEDEG